MSLVRDSVAGVRMQIDNETLVPTLTRRFSEDIGHRPSPAEIRSWERSLVVLVEDLETAGLHEVEVLVEYKLPLTSLRADALLCGVHPDTRDPSYVVVELKQWTHALLEEGTDDVVSIPGIGPRLHPVEQVRRYGVHMEDFIEVLSDHPDRLAAVAYLHNATEQDAELLRDLDPGDRCALFTGQTRHELQRFLRARLSPVSGARAADDLARSPVHPSKQLLALAAEEIQSDPQFVLLDQQKTAYSMVLRAVERSYAGAEKEVIVVTGGPGSGKSVIALSLLGELSRQGRTSLHATGSSAFTQTLRRVAGRRAPRVKQLFKYYNQFVDAAEDSLDVLICDEAHRIKETSTNRYTPARMRTGRPQVEELIEVARVPVFLLDEHQVVRPSEKGTTADIEAAALRLGCKYEQIDLNGQFRCGGSRAYENWVLRLLGLEQGGPIPWHGDESFELDVAPAPSVMEEHLRTLLSEGYSSRMAAGYCWRWRDPVNGHGLPLDVVIGDWKRPWNNKKETSFEGAPGTPYWASDPAGFEQIGCVYTAQGFEYDYGGVIMGRDLVWRQDHWVAQPQFSHDNQVKRGSAQEFDRAIRNTYKVLLTRGMRGMVVFSTDAETQRLLESLIATR